MPALDYPDNVTFIDFFIAFLKIIYNFGKFMGNNSFSATLLLHETLLMILRTFSIKKPIKYGWTMS